MCRDELVTMVTRRPFRPFRVSVSDGTDFVVLRPEMIMVTHTTAVVGIVGESSSHGAYPQIDRFAVVDLLHITRAAELSSNGK